MAWNAGCGLETQLKIWMGSTVNGSMGLSGKKAMKVSAPMVISGAVSPMARDRARMMPVSVPGRAAGSTMPHTTWERVAPQSWPLFAREWGYRWGRLTVVDLEADALEQAGKPLRDLPMRAVVAQVSAALQAQGWGLLSVDAVASRRSAVVAQLERRAAAMQSLLQSLTPAQRRELEALQEALLQDPALREGLDELGEHLARLNPERAAPGYRLEGDEPLSLQQAQQLMERLHELDGLEAALRQAEQGGDPGELDPDTVREALGDDAARQVADLQRLARLLEDAGYLDARGRRWTLTPAAVRRIGPVIW